MIVSPYHRFLHKSVWFRALYSDCQKNEPIREGFFSITWATIIVIGTLL
jgi:hypothetical protein